MDKAVFILVIGAIFMSVFVPFVLLLMILL